MNKLLLQLALLGFFFSCLALAAAEKKLVCYYGSWAVYRHGNGKFDVENIDAFACTHIIYGFLGLGANNQLEVLDPYNDLEENWGRGAMKRFSGLKRQNPNLKALVAIGGWNEGSEKYSQMAKDPAKRRAFVQSVVPFLQSEGFDGFDVDWEYPANREGAAPEDKENFVLLLNELRAELNPHGYLLTAAVSAGASTIATAYDIPAVCSALDFINVMAYDFHGAWENFTGHHSPLYGNEDIDYGNNIMLNSDYAIHYWMDHGCPSEKLILGTGTYGRGFLLDDPTKNGLYAPAQQALPAGPYTATEGFWGYNELLEKINAQPGQWTVVNDVEYEVPYAYNTATRNWIGYDTPASMSNKAHYINANNLGGGMIWSIETDDFLGLYSTEKFPLTKALYRGLNGEYPPPPSTTTEDPRSTTKRTTTTAAPPPPNNVCKVVGANPDPENPCSPKFYNCHDDGNGNWDSEVVQCPGGLVFNPSGLSCDYPENVDGCSQGSTRPPTTTTEDAGTSSTTSQATSGAPTTTEPASTTNGGTPPPNNVCKVDGPNPDPENPCSSIFYNCHTDGNGEWESEVVQCPGGLVFHPIGLSCDYPENVDGCSKGSTRPPMTTTEGAGSTVATSQGTSAAPTTVASTTNAGPPPEHNICKKVGINPDPTNDCTKVFYMCTEDEDGTWEVVSEECPLELIFNPSNGVCDFQWNVEGCKN